MIMATSFPGEKGGCAREEMYCAAVAPLVLPTIPRCSEFRVLDLGLEFRVCLLLSAVVRYYL